MPIASWSVNAGGAVPASRWKSSIEWSIIAITQSPMVSFASIPHWKPACGRETAAGGFASSAWM